MNRILDGFLVGLVLLAGFGYVLYSFGPKALRRRVSAATPKAAGACGGCDNCGSDAPAATTEIRIPLAAIDKRR